MLDPSQRETPASWDRRKIKFHLSGFFGGGTPSKDNLDYWTDGNVPWVTPKDMKRRMIDTAEDLITVDAVKNSATNMVPPNSVLMVVRSGILKHSLPVALNTVPVALNQDMKAFRFRRSLLPEFFAYWIEGQQKQKLLEWCQIGATVDNINVDAMLNAQIAVPDLATQRQIADFLDRETARIDLLIEKKQRLIHALDEKHDSLVNAAVLGKRLPGSGGKPPAPSDRGFECVPLRRHLLKVTNGTTATQIEESNGAKRVTRIETISNGDVNLGKIGFVDGAEKLGQFVLRAGDILFSHINSMSVIGNSAIVNADVLPLYVGMNVLRLRPSSNVHPKFFAWCLKSHFVRHQIRQFAKPAINQASISTSNLKRVLAPLPDIATQKEIADFLDRATLQMAHVKGKIAESIDRLKEYRSALIAAAVTGQIDVTTYAKSGTPDRRLDAIQQEMGA